MGKGGASVEATAFGLRVGSAITRRSGRTVTASFRARSVGAAFFHTWTIRATLVTLGFVRTTDLLARTIRRALFHQVLEGFHFASEALDLATKFFRAGISITPLVGTTYGVGAMLRATRSVRTRIGNALG